MMAAKETQQQSKPNAGFAALWRFLPMLWPKGEVELRVRVVAAVVLVLAGKAATLLMPFAYKAVVDGMSSHRQPFAMVAMLVAGYAAARFAGVLSDNLRNALFEKVGQDAARRLAGQVFRHVHDLSLRFHLERRTGSLTKIVERGTKSIDMMLYFLLFNIGPTLIELTAACVIFFVKFGAGLVAATLAMVALYIVFTARDRLAHTASAADERRRQQGDRSRGRQPAELRDSQIFRGGGARGASATTKRSAPSLARPFATKCQPRMAQHRPGADHQPDDGRRDDLHRVGLEHRPLHAGRRRVRSTRC